MKRETRETVKLWVLRVAAVVFVVAFFAAACVAAYADDGSDPAPWYALVWAWIERAQLPLIAGLIVVDVALGVAVAVQASVFRWAEVLEFYRTMVVPYFLAYLVVQLVLEAVDVGPVIGDGVPAAMFGVAVYNLGASIARNLATLGRVVQMTRQYKQQ